MHGLEFPDGSMQVPSQRVKTATRHVGIDTVNVAACISNVFWHDVLSVCMLWRRYTKICWNVLHVGCVVHAGCVCSS